MGIEKDINQQTFRNDYQKAAINLIYTYHWLNEKMKVYFDNEGITSQQFNILRILRGAGVPISTMQIRERMLDKMSDTSRIVDRLVLKGLAQKNVCKNDKRLVDVSITTKGRKLLEKLDTHEKDMDATFGNLSDSEAMQLNKLLDKIRQPR
ncbi:MAG TPA: MarR family transcriptional regulator [Ferruginibacter sp.]|nr:MarR family transcriptional regulator [Ferruginibacter sp.]HMX36760.1 MarR family transcriptional regulator [Ferruginibacter sp.]HNJ94021.1 MarR family transcriptional regulator [Ferruginibacter sp.]HNK28834.1 MarR family transcriptional regulator [Ferruginibacter sp.]HNN71491.1 MarR family transcriptional regulator [Ferruginibacter sp.]